MVTRFGNDTGVLDPDATIIRQSGRGRLLIVRGPNRGDWVPLGDEPLTVGSGEDSDVVLADPTVSRRHLVASLGDSGVRVRDLGSKNGSYVQGARFQELLLGFGAEIYIGKTVLKYVPEEEEVDPVPAERDRFGQILGVDPEIRKMMRVLDEVSPTNATILIEGETGTGKELIAEEIHAHSTRRQGPFVVFDCGAVPRELLESSLFGHLRGAFTGAVSDRRGAFAEADGGTLFLDEIGELALDMQPALLRVIDKRMIRPLGASGYQRVDVRIVAATNRSLRDEVAARRFREDLYYRIAVVKIAVPPLRKRPDDIPLLAHHFARQLGGGRPLALSADDMQRLVQHPWPGNARELRNVIERMTIGSGIGPADLLEPGGLATSPAPSQAEAEGDLSYKEAKAEVVAAFEREYFQRLFERHGRNLSAAARAAQLDRKHLRDLLRKHGLREDAD